MSESKKLLIGFAVVGAICCCMAVGAFWGMSAFGKQVGSLATGSDPTAVAEMRNKIVDFDQPPGYQPGVMSMVIYDVIYLMPVDSSDDPMIMLMQYNATTSANREQIERSLRQSAERQGPQPGVSMRVVDSFETVIRGETVTVSVSEGGGQNLAVRQWITVFDGNNGLVLLMIQGPVASWDDEMVETFIKSIR
ncbi:MAG: hypothetical protein HYU84_11425 [Chloroflexi bacterium]|nr:hypothetical protein [Chloroflexota bacterium]